LPFGAKSAILIVQWRTLDMASAQVLTTTLSPDGRVKLPQSVRDRCNWAVGAELVIEETADGVLLRQASRRPTTTIAEVFGMLKYSGPPVTIEDMDAALMAEARRHAGD
jgi:bifunctional DNA-binding transcriptional regulator/antitoxin component of YhaV-PrlF toxin-antitoxin module